MSVQKLLAEAHEERVKESCGVGAHYECLKIN